jgi:outer membrane protein OmpA-like peptidoglycan-associated protein
MNAKPRNGLIFACSTCKSTLLRAQIIIIALLFLGTSANAQLKVDTFQSVNHLVENVLLGSGVKAYNIKFTGNKSAIGLFVNDSTKLRFNKGVLLTTGRVHEALGPNDLPRMSGVHQGAGDLDLEKIARGRTYDVAALEFDFKPTSSQLSFNFIFASEEYTEFVNSEFNDVFAFLVTGPGLTGAKNIALLPDGKTPITINNVNNIDNPQYYIDNNLWNDDMGMRHGREDSLKTPESPYSIEFDGFTTLLEANIKVVPNQTYHIKIAIADVGDFGLDSGVFLEAGSFVSKPGDDEPVVIQDAIPEHTGPLDPDLATIIEPEFMIFFDYDETAIKASEKQKLDKLLLTMQKETSLTLHLHGHTDNIASDTYNQKLSLRRAKAVKKYLVSKGVTASRIECDGQSETNPIARNDIDKGRAQNRRVELTVIEN